MSSFRVSPAIIIHGGAGGKCAEEYIQRMNEGMRTCAQAGYEVLSRGGSALDAVECAVRLLEDSALFNAGLGSALTAAGEVEMDAMIMDGKTFNAGSVACVHNIRNPVCLARHVMQDTNHILLVAHGADQFAEKIGMEKVESSVLVASAKKRWAEVSKSAKDSKPEPDKRMDTVGAVAIDCNGNLATATSTGGISGKMTGRVGDSPLIGSGGYADDLAGACSATGYGENIAKVTLARHAVYLMEGGMKPTDACVNALKYMKDRVGGVGTTGGGLIAIDRHGRIGYAFNTDRMNYAFTSDGQSITIGIS